MDRGAWWATVQGVTKTWPWLCDWATCMSVVIDLFKSNYKILKSWYIIFYLFHIHFIPHPFCFLLTWSKVFLLLLSFSSVQSLSRVRLFVTPWIAAHQASLSITNSWSSLRLTSMESVTPIQPSHPLSSPSPPAPNPSQHQSLFQWVNSSHEVAKVLEFQL